MYPAVLLLNLTPTSTAEASLESVVPGVVVDVQIEHGQAVVLDDVVNDQVTGVNGLPLASAPLTLAVYTVETVRAALGVNVAVCVELLYAEVPLTGVVPGPASATLVVVACMGSLNVALTVVLVGTFVVPLAGLWPVTVGGVVSGAEGAKTTSTQ